MLKSRSRCSVEKFYFSKKKSAKRNSRKLFFKKKNVCARFSNEKYQAYKYLQAQFNKFDFLIHFDLNQFLYINVNVFKQKDFEVIIFHVLNDSMKKIIVFKNEIQFVIFLNKQLSKTKKKYRFTKLKMTKLI